MKQLDFRSAPILLIGREPEMLGLLREVLLDAGFFVVARLSDGFLLNLDRMREHPSLIVYDEAQPEIDAERVFFLLQDAPEWRQIPFVILSDIYDGTRISRCLDRGVAEFIPKPFDVDELAARTRKILREVIRQAQTPEPALLAPQSEVQLDGFAGDLAYMNLSDLLINLDQNVRTGELTVSMTEGEYRFLLHRGRLAKVEGPGQMLGRKAFFRAMRLFYGRFVFTPQPEDVAIPDAQDFGPLPHLVLQAVQEADEYPLTRTQLPAHPERVCFASDQPDTGLFANDINMFKPILRSPDRHATIDEMIAHSIQTDLNAARLLLDLYQSGDLIPSQA